MLDTAFNKKFLPALSKAQRKARSKSENEVWSYIGRFITGFALVEYQVNELFHALINVDYPALILLTYTLDLRKRLELIQIILKSRGIDESATFKRVHSLHDLRNVIAHWPFSKDEDGLWCDFIDKYRHLDFGKPTTKDRDRVIKFAEFDSYDADASELYDKLEELLASATPLTDVDNDLRIAIEGAISSSDNVVRFPSRPHTDDKH
jgi:hypothetical protein